MDAAETLADVTAAYILNARARIERAGSVGPVEGVVRPADTLARISGDEFVVLCEDLDVAAEADEIARRSVEIMEQPLSLTCGTVRVGVSVGVAESLPGDAPSVHLLERADKAMYQAKRRGGGGHHVSSRRRSVSAPPPAPGAEPDIVEG